MRPLVRFEYGGSKRGTGNLLGGTLHLLFVCTGNICRSPMAERLALVFAAERGIRDLTAESAGTRAVISHPMHHEAANVLSALGGQPADFSARQLTPRLVANSDLILTMMRAHRHSVLELVPRKLNRTFTLREASMLVTELGAELVEDLAELRSRLASDTDNGLDVRDPIGHTSDVFTAVGDEIADLLPPIIEVCGRSIDYRL